MRRTADIQPGIMVCDCMCGMGECWPFIAARLRGEGTIIGVDFCPEMCRRARANASRYQSLEVRVLEEDALESSLSSGCVDVVLGSFAVKTLEPGQLDRFSCEVRRILRPGGTFAFLEISIPPGFLNRPYRGYLKHVIPGVGRLCLGNPDNYRLLGVYTEAFRDCGRLASAMGITPLDVITSRFFFGCATAVSGKRPAD